MKTKCTHIPCFQNESLKLVAEKKAVTFLILVELDDTGAVLNKAKWACDELSLLKNSSKNTWESVHLLKCFETLQLKTCHSCVFISTELPPASKQ